LGAKESLDEVAAGVWGSRLCSKCAHVNVCSVYRAIAGLLNSFEIKKPFEPFELARICGEFLPVSIKAYSEFKSFTQA